MSFWESIKNFFRKLFGVVRFVGEYVVDFVIELIGQIVGTPFLSIFVKALTNLGRWIWKKVFIIKNDHYVYDEAGNIIGYIDINGYVHLYQYAEQYVYTYR
jgi:hypothetical protein